MHFVRSFVVRLLIDSTPGHNQTELRGSVVPVATQEAHLFKDSAGLLELLARLAQDDGIELDGKSGSNGELQ